MYLMENLVHFLERAAGGFGLERKVSKGAQPCTAEKPHVKEVDARHHKCVDDGEDDIGLDRDALAMPKGSR